MRVKWNRTLDGAGGRESRQRSGSLQGSDFEAEDGDKIRIAPPGFFGFFRGKNKTDGRRSDDGQSLCSLSSSNAETGSAAYFQRHVSLPVRWRRRPLPDGGLLRRGSCDNPRDYSFGVLPTRCLEEAEDYVNGSVANASLDEFPSSRLPGSSRVVPEDSNFDSAKSASLSECQSADTDVASRQRLPDFSSQSIKSLASATGSSSSERSNFLDVARSFFSRSKSARKSDVKLEQTLKRSVSESCSASSATLPPKSPTTGRWPSRSGPSSEGNRDNDATCVVVPNAKASRKLSDFFSSFRTKGKPSDREWASSKLPRPLKYPKPPECQGTGQPLANVVGARLHESFAKCSARNVSYRKENVSVGGDDFGNGVAAKEAERNQRLVSDAAPETKKGEDVVLVQYQIAGVNNVRVTHAQTGSSPARAVLGESEIVPSEYRPIPRNTDTESGSSHSPPPVCASNDDCVEGTKDDRLPQVSVVKCQNFSSQPSFRSAAAVPSCNLFSESPSNDAMLSSTNSDYDNRGTMSLKQDTQVPLFRNGVTESIDSVFLSFDGRSQRCENESFPLLEKARRISNSSSSLEMILKSFDSFCAADPSEGDSVASPSIGYLNGVNEIGVLQKSDPALRKFLVTKAEDDPLGNNSLSPNSVSSNLGNEWFASASFASSETHVPGFTDQDLKYGIEDVNKDTFETPKNVVASPGSLTNAREELLLLTECVLPTSLPSDVGEHCTSINRCVNIASDRCHSTFNSYICEMRGDISQCARRSLSQGPWNPEERKIDRGQECSIVGRTAGSFSEERIVCSDTLGFTETEEFAKGERGDEGGSTGRDASLADFQPPSEEGSSTLESVNKSPSRCPDVQSEKPAILTSEISVPKDMHGLGVILDRKEQLMTPYVSTPRPNKPSGNNAYQICVSSPSPLVTSSQCAEATEEASRVDEHLVNGDAPHFEQSETQQRSSYTVVDSCFHSEEFSADESCPCCGEIPSPCLFETKDKEDCSHGREPSKFNSPVINEESYPAFDASRASEKELSFMPEISDAKRESAKQTIEFLEIDEKKPLDERPQLLKEKKSSSDPASVKKTEKSGKKKNNAREIQKPKTVVGSTLKFAAAVVERTGEKKKAPKATEQRHRNRTKSQLKKEETTTPEIVSIPSEKSKDRGTERLHCPDLRLFDTSASAKGNSRSLVVIPCSESPNSTPVVALTKCKSEEVLSSVACTYPNTVAECLGESWKLSLSAVHYEPVGVVVDETDATEVASSEVCPRGISSPFTSPRGVGQVRRSTGPADTTSDADSSSASKLSAAPAMARGKSSRIPRKQQQQGSTSSRPLVAPRPVRPPMWLSKAELGHEIQHLSTLCETRTKELNKLRLETRHVSAGFEALAVVIRYMSAELDAFKVPGLMTDLKLAEEKIQKGRTDLVFYEKEIQRVNGLHMKEVNKISHQLSEEYDSKFREMTEKHKKDVELVREEQVKEITCLNAALQASCDEEKQQHLKMLDDLQQELRKQREEMEIFHQHELDDLEELHLGKQRSLLAEIEKLQKQCAEAKQLSLTVEEALQKDTDTKLQWLSAKKTDLQNEVDSLKAVLEIKNNELHALRKENLEMQKELEDLPLAKEKIKMLQARAEDLQALVAEKVKHERQLSSEHQFMKETYEKETKVNMRLSMENEELLWRLRQASECSSILSATLPDECCDVTGDVSVEENLNSSVGCPLTLSEEPSPPPSPAKSAPPKFFTYMNQEELNALSPQSPRTAYKRIQPHKSPQATRHVVPASPKSSQSPARRGTDSEGSTPRKLARHHHRHHHHHHHQNRSFVDEEEAEHRRRGPVARGEGSPDERVENECFGRPVTTSDSVVEGACDVPSQQDETSPDDAVVDPKSFYQMAFPVGGEAAQDSEESPKEGEEPSLPLV